MLGTELFRRKFVLTRIENVAQILEAAVVQVVVMPGNNAAKGCPRASRNF